MNRTGLIAVLSMVVQLSHAQPQTVDRTVAAQPRGQVVITNVAGDIQIQGWDRDEVRVRGELDRGVKTLEVTAAGERTLINVVPERGRDHAAARLSLQVPRHSALVLNTVSADVRIAQVQGAQRLQSVSGDIETELGEGYFEARTVSGNIHAKGSDAGQGLRITTVSGDVRLEGIGPDADVTTISGELDIVAQEMARVLLKSVSGDVRLRTALADLARVQAESVNGQVRMQLLGTPHASIEAKTFRGALKHCFDAAASGDRSAGPGRELRINQGEGSATVLVKTLNGDIDVCN